MNGIELEHVLDFVRWPAIYRVRELMDQVQLVDLTSQEILGARRRVRVGRPAGERADRAGASTHTQHGLKATASPDSWTRYSKRRCACHSPQATMKLPGSRP